MTDTQARMMMIQIAMEGMRLGKDIVVEQKDYHDIRSAGSLSGVKTDDTGIVLRVYSMGNDEDETEEDSEEKSEENTNENAEVEWRQNDGSIYQRYESAK